MFTGYAKRKKDEAERLRKQKEAALALAQQPKRDASVAGGGGAEKTADPVPAVKPSDPALAALYNEGLVGNTKLKVRKSDTGQGQTVNASGLCRRWRWR